MTDTSMPKTESLLSEQEIREAPESDYMNEQQLAFFRALLIELHNTTREHIQQTKALMLGQKDMADECDRASWEEQFAISMRIVDREQKLLPKIKLALERIRHKTYGYCLESDEPIGIPRLLARPTAEYCADLKDIQERKEYLYGE